jgi:cobalt/nickel transport system permease protein
MAHIHLEDGAFTLFWVAVWSLIAAGIVSAALFRQGGNKMPTRKLAIAAMFVAVGFAIFQVEIPVFGGVHMNLTPLMGILLGPSLGTLSVLIINIFSAAIGHGGWGMIGANTIVNAVEVVLGYYVYRLLRSSLRLGRFPSGFGAAAIALTVSAFVVVGIVTASELQDSTQTRDQTFNNMLVLAAANIVMGLVEGVVTGYMASFIGRIRPDLLEEAEGGGPRDRQTETPGEAAHV